MSSRRHLCVRSLAVAGATLLASLALLPASAAASSPGTVNGGPQAISAQGSIAPGDWLAVGWDASMAGHHASATLQVTQISASFAVSCGKKSDTFMVTLHPGNGQATIAENDNHWYPTDRSDAAQSYQFSTRAPDLCGGGPMYVSGGGKGGNGADHGGGHNGGDHHGDRGGRQSGVTYGATLISNDTSDQFAIRFHTVDAASSGKGEQSNLDCSNPQQNSSGGGPCDGGWSQPATSNAAPPPPSQGSAPTTPAPSGGSASATHGAGGATATDGGTPAGGGSPSFSLGRSIPGAVSPAAAPGLGTGGAPFFNGGAVTVTRPHQPSSGGQPATANPSSVVSGAAPSTNSVLSPLPVLVPTVGAAIARASELPWKWFLALALFDGLLIGGIILRRRAARTRRWKSLSDRSDHNTLRRDMK